MEAWKLELYGYNDELYHFGTKGMKWGTRHWQNDDGSFNAAGKERYFGKGSGENYKSVVKAKKQAYKKAYKDYSKSVDTLGRKQYSLSKKKRAEANEYAGEVYKKAQKAEKARQEYKEAKNANKKQLTLEQKQKIAKAAVGALAAAAVVGGTVYLAKTGKLNNVADAGKKLINKGKDAVSKKIESISQNKLNSKLSDWTKNVQDKHSAAMDKVLGARGTAKREILERQSNMSDAKKAEVAKKQAENTKKLLDKMYQEKLNDPNVTKWSMTIDGQTRSFDRTPLKTIQDIDDFFLK